MLRQLIAWDADGNVVATVDYMVAKDENGNVVGLLDFEAHEQANGRLREIWENDHAVGSGTWPEWIGGQVHEFKVELDPAPQGQRAKINALVHKSSGHRRERAAIERAIAERIRDSKAKGQPAADLRDLLGGPRKPLAIDSQGRTRSLPKTKTELPFLAARKKEGRNGGQ
jgi:hypothetical protein